MGQLRSHRDEGGSKEGPEQVGPPEPPGKRWGGAGQGHLPAPRVEGVDHPGNHAVPEEGSLPVGVLRRENRGKVVQQPQHAAHVRVPGEQRPKVLRGPAAPSSLQGRDHHHRKHLRLAVRRGRDRLLHPGHPGRVRLQGVRVPRGLGGAPESGSRRPRPDAVPPAEPPERRPLARRQHADQPHPRDEQREEAEDHGAGMLPVGRGQRRGQRGLRLPPLRHGRSLGGERGPRDWDWDWDWE
mmetsp:Transcript_4178/g.12178  ORF Transcript_4178/g.12178 Transcript_4178/m.12178 type:complete len:240 (+) Transcript_4178:693-1412(+)